MPPTDASSSSQRADSFSRPILAALSLCIAVLALYHLTEYPASWFDEGLHLQVAKTLATLGVYGDHTAGGFEYDGAVVNLGPVVILPIAAAFKVFGVGLLQARLVMVVYLFVGLCVFYRLTRMLGGPVVALAALAFLITSPEVSLFNTGRQVLGEVPALTCALAAMLTWLAAWDGSPRRLTAAGVLFGLAALAKYQIVLAFAPTIVIAWTLNLVYYRTAPHRVFIIPAVVAFSLFAAWQGWRFATLGAEITLRNWHGLREEAAAQAAAFVVSAVRRSAAELVSFRTYGGALPLALAYGAWLSAPRSRAAQMWGTVWLFAASNLTWYLCASIGWRRYAFTGLAISSIFVGKLFVDLLQRLASNGNEARGSEPSQEVSVHPPFADASGLRAAVLAWVSLILVTSTAVVALPILRPPPPNSAAQIAKYLDASVPRSAVIESWEPEVEFLTDHTVSRPPTAMMNMAVRHIWLGEPPPWTRFDRLRRRPDFVLVGGFGRWVQAYEPQVLADDYHSVKSIGSYELFQRNAHVALATGP